MSMHDPAHPGELLQNYIGERTVTEVAQHLGVTRAALSRILNGRAGISADMALRISQLFDTDPAFWLRLQTQHDLWRASQTPPKIVLFPSHSAQSSERAAKRSSRKRA